MLVGVEGEGFEEGGSGRETLVPVRMRSRGRCCKTYIRSLCSDSRTYDRTSDAFCLLFSFYLKGCPVVCSRTCVIWSKAKELWLSTS